MNAPSTTLTAADRALAAGIAQAHPLGQQPASHRYFRVEAEWQGGGVWITLPFANEQAAAAWGENKAKGHADAVITVRDRGPATYADSQAAAEADARAVVLREGDFTEEELLAVDLAMLRRKTDINAQRSQDWKAGCAESDWADKTRSFL